MLSFVCMNSAMHIITLGVISHLNYLHSIKGVAHCEDKFVIS